MDRRQDGRETWNRLLDWDKGQAPSERLAGTLMVSEGYVGFDPSHPLGGQDGTKDAILEKDSLKLVLAVYFPRGQQSFTSIQTKFLDDLKGVEKNNANGLVFCTNQELRLGERNDLQVAAATVPVEIYHLERLATLLNVPANYGVRLEFLQIAMTNEELISLYAQRDKDYLLQLATITDNLNFATETLVCYNTGGDSYLRFDVHPNSNGLIDVTSIVESKMPHSPGRFPLSSVNIEISSDTGHVTSHNGHDIHLNIVNKFPSLTLPADRLYKFYSFQVVAKNGQYRQYFMFKKHTDGNWYYHAIRWNDLHDFSLREEEFAANYPDQLKHQYPLVADYRPNSVDLKRPLDDWPGRSHRKNGHFYGL